MVAGDSDTGDGSVRLKLGVLTALNTNESQVYSWFGGNYLTRLAGIITERLRAAVRQAELIVRIAFAMGRAIGTANQYTDGRAIQLSRSVSNLKRVLFNDYTVRILNLTNESRSNDASILSQAASFFNSSIKFTKQQVGALGQTLGSQINILRSDVFGTFGLLIPGLPTLVVLAEELDKTDVDDIADFFENIYESVKEFLKDPLGFILGWLIKNLLNLLFDVVATEIGGGEGDLPAPKFSSEVSL